MMNTPYGIPPNSTTIEKIVPLTPKIALLVNNLGLKGYLKISPNMIYEINNRTILYSHEYVISPKLLLNKVVNRWIEKAPQSLLMYALTELDKLKKNK